MHVIQEAETIFNTVLRRYIFRGKSLFVKNFVYETPVPNSIA